MIFLFPFFFPIKQKSNPAVFDTESTESCNVDTLYRKKKKIAIPFLKFFAKNMKYFLLFTLQSVFSYAIIGKCVTKFSGICL